MSQFFKTWATDYKRGLVIRLIAAVIGVPLALLCIVGTIMLGTWLASVDDRLVPWFLGGFFVVGLAATPVIVLGPIVLSIWRRSRWLDGIFGPVGLQGRLYMLRGRQYRGIVQEHEVDIRFYQGPTLDMYITTPLMTRFSVTARSAVIPGLAQLFGREPLVIDDPELSVFAADADWMRMLLAQPAARAALTRLMRASNWAAFRQVHLRPGAFLFRLYRNSNLFSYDISPAEGRQWLDDLLTLARVAESLPAPQVTALPSSAELLVRSGKIGKITWPVTIIMVIALVVGMPLCAIAITVATLVLAK